MSFIILTLINILYINESISIFYKIKYKSFLFKSFLFKSSIFKISDYNTNIFGKDILFKPYYDVENYNNYNYIYIKLPPLITYNKIYNNKIYNKIYNNKIYNKIYNKIIYNKIIYNKSKIDFDIILNHQNQY